MNKMNKASKNKAKMTSNRNKVTKIKTSNNKRMIWRNNNSNKWQNIKITKIRDKRYS